MVARDVVAVEQQRARRQGQRRQLGRAGLGSLRDRDVLLGDLGDLGLLGRGLGNLCLLGLNSGLDLAISAATRPRSDPGRRLIAGASTAATSASSIEDSVGASGGVTWLLSSNAAANSACSNSCWSKSPSTSTGSGMNSSIGSKKSTGASGASATSSSACSASARRPRPQRPQRLLRFDLGLDLSLGGRSVGGLDVEGRRLGRGRRNGRVHHVNNHVVRCFLGLDSLNGLGRLHLGYGLLRVLDLGGGLLAVSTSARAPQRSLLASGSAVSTSKVSTSARTPRPRDLDRDLGRGLLDYRLLNSLGLDCLRLVGRKLIGRQLVAL